MHTKKAKYHLKRIETILDLHEGNLSAMDRDIILEDIRHLYDLVLFANETHPEHKTHTAQDKTFVAPVPTPIIKATPEHTSPVERPEPTPSPVAEVTAPVEDAEEPSRHTATHASHEEAVHTPTTITYEESSAKPETSYSEQVYDKNPSVHSSNGSADNTSSGQLREEEEEVMVHEQLSYPELFDFAFSTDLSDRLSNTKIDNLNRILTINDKILFINHLFGGEAIPFQDTLKKFESFYTYDEAKQYASSELVVNYNWTSNDKFDTVRQFMRQVKRLYS